MDDDAQPAPAYEWATHSEPDLLVVQVPAVPVAIGAGGATDALRTLMTLRGFRPVERDDELGLRPSTGCLLTQAGPSALELLVTIGPRVGATRMLLSGLDPAWVERVVAAGHAAVLVADTAVGPDGTTSREALRADVEAGGVLGALVPASAP